MATACITLLTDYGSKGGLVGLLHVVALSIAPASPVIDLDHSIPPWDVRLGALRLERAVPYLPAGVHVGVVDPGVGGDRRGVAVEAGRHVFVGPDNGLLVWAVAAAGGARRAVLLDDDRYFLSPRSATFDGRDVFVPVAAHLAAGVDLADVGTAIDPAGLSTIERPAPRYRPGGAVELEVLQVDAFGNVQLAGDHLVAGLLGLTPGDRVVLAGGGHKDVVATYATTFSDVPAGEPLVLLDGDGQLAFSVNCGRGDEILGVRLGEAVGLRRLP